MADARPNLLLVTSDQHRADTLGCAGHPCVRTPHLDQLAREGVRFDNAYADCPVCIPARTTLITGRRAHENGQPNYAADWRLGRDRRLLLGSLLTAAGYQTELVGKTHWHTDPDDRGGFEHVTWLAGLKRRQLAEAGRAGTLVGLGANEVSPTRSQFPPHLHSTDWCVDRACEFLATRQRSQPFALWLSLTDPHPPLAIHEPYYSMYAPADVPPPVVPAWVGTDAEPWELYCQRHQWNAGPMSDAELRHARAVYAGMVTNLDHQLGRLVGQAQRLGDWADTLVVYTSDHGEHLGDLGAIGKTTFYECSARVPLIARPPASWRGGGYAPGRVSRDLVEWCDLLPTLCEAAGAEVPGDVTGRSLAGAIRGGALPPHRMHGQVGGSHLLHDGRFKYLYSTHDGSEQCFDTDDDPRDERPIGGEPLDRLRRAFVEHLRSEGHPHLVGGAPLNERRARPPVNELRAKDVAGLAGAQHLADVERGVLHAH